MDANVLVLAANLDADGSRPCRDHLESLRNGRAPWYTTWGICYEFVRVITHRRAIEAPWSFEGAIAFLASLFASRTHQSLIESDRHLSVLTALGGEHDWLRGSRLHDAHTVAIMREHGLQRILTRDADFRRFDGVEVIDPVTAPVGP